VTNWKNSLLAPESGFCGVIDVDVDVDVDNDNEELNNGVVVTNSKNSTTQLYVVLVQ